MFTAKGARALFSKAIDSGTTAKRTFVVVPIHSEVIVLGIPTEDLQSIASILAAGYLRHRDQLRRAVPRLDCSETSSRHGHEVNGYENGERNGDRDAERD